MSNPITSPENDNDSEMQIDPALASAMSFTGFGAQPSKKKRKFDDNNNDSFVDPSIGNNNKPRENGANNIPIGQRNPPQVAKGQSQVQVQEQSTTVPAAQKSDGPEARAPSFQSGCGASDAGEMEEAGVSAQGPPSLEALRWGVRNERGDLVVFMPSFVEDPWRGLKI